MNTSAATASAFRHHTIPGIGQRSINSTTRAVDGSHLSYNPSRADYGCDTTALVLHGRVFLILNGDHREGMFSAFDTGGIQAAASYFIDHLAQAHPNSEHQYVTGLAADPFGLIPTAVQCLGQDMVDRMASAARALSEGV